MKNWTTVFGKEYGRMSQVGNKLTQKELILFFKSHDEIDNIPEYQIVTYARIYLDFRPQKEELNRVRTTAGGNIIKYYGNLRTRTADLTTSKVLCNSLLSKRYKFYIDQHWTFLSGNDH